MIVSYSPTESLLVRQSQNRQGALSFRGGGEEGEGAAPFGPSLGYGPGARHWSMYALIMLLFSSMLC